MGRSQRILHAHYYLMTTRTPKTPEDMNTLVFFWHIYKWHLSHSRIFSSQTGLTPLMEAASGGYADVGRVLIEKGADVNAPPVPSSRDTALTIAADKGHYRFVELLLSHGAAVDVKNKKGNSPLWLACNGK